MTACAIETAPQTHPTTRPTGHDTTGPAPDGAAAPGSGRTVRGVAERTIGDATTAHRDPAPLTLAADGSYAARLAVCRATGERFPERWTLGGPAPYAVPLPANQPEEPESEVLPLADGRVLIRRRIAERHALSLLYPAGRGTGELPLGSVECGELSLLPPAPCGRRAYALEPGERSTHVWLVHGGSFGPEHIAEVPGRCTAGSWLDRTGRLLALDRALDGRVKTVVVDLQRGGETTPLLQITEDSDDRLVLADPDSGLLIVRSNAPGRERLGWGVLGSALPVRFPDCLDPRPADPRAIDPCAIAPHIGGAAHTAVRLTPFAAQPGQVRAPEHCAVAFRLTPKRPGGGASWIAVWRPAERRLQHLSAPPGWLTGAGLWTHDGELHLPYTTAQTACGLARVRATALAPQPPANPRRPAVARSVAVTRPVAATRPAATASPVGTAQPERGRTGQVTGAQPGEAAGPGRDGARGTGPARGAAPGTGSATGTQQPAGKPGGRANRPTAPRPGEPEPAPPAHERCADPRDRHGPGPTGTPPPGHRAHPRHEAAAPHQEADARWGSAHRPAPPAAPRPVPLQQAPLDGAP